MSEQDPIERRLGDSGLPALPRTAWLEVDLDRLVAARLHWSATP